MNGLLAHSHNGFFSCGTRKKTFSLLQRPPCCLSSFTRKMWWFCSAYPLLSISSAANGATSEKRWRVSKGWRVALPLFTFLKAPLQAGGNKAELGPLHPPSKEHVSHRSAVLVQDQGLHPGAGLFALWLHCARGELHSLMQEVLALTSGRWKVHAPLALFFSF